MRRFVCRILTAVTVFMLASGAWAQGRIGTVDMSKVFSNYWKTKQADSVIKDRLAELEKEHKNMLEDWKKAKEDYQSLLAAANETAISGEERDRRKRNADDKLKSIKEQEEALTQYERQARTTLEEQSRRMRLNILTEIRGVLEAKAKASGYSMVIDSASESANGVPMVLYNNNEADITDMVLKELNATAPPDVVKAEDTKDTKKDDKKEKDKK